jgi:hypothetical protein
MILTRCVDCAHGEVERADPAHHSDKTTHGESHIPKDYNYEAAEDAVRAIGNDLLIRFCGNACVSK